MEGQCRNYGNDRVSSYSYNTTNMTQTQYVLSTLYATVTKNTPHVVITVLSCNYMVVTVNKNIIIL